MSSSAPRDENAIQLDADAIAALTAAVEQQIRERDELQLVTTAFVAERLSVHPDWVRTHARELGGIRLDGGRYGELRFDMRLVRAEMERRRLATDPRPRRRRSGRRRAPAVDLLPIPDR